MRLSLLLVEDGGHRLRLHFEMRRTLFFTFFVKLLKVALNEAGVDGLARTDRVRHQRRQERHVGDDAAHIGLSRVRRLRFRAQPRGFAAYAITFASIAS